MSTTDFPPAPPISIERGSEPLSSVMPTIRTALGCSKTALFEACHRILETDARATALQHAKSHLQQAYHVLQTLDLEGISVLTQAAEQAFDRFADNTLECSADHAQTVADLYQALIEHLEKVLFGAPWQALRLFPYHRAMQEMLGIQRIHPADLFFPKLPAPEDIAPAGQGVPVDYPACRQHFEKALLPFLKSGASADANALHDAIKLVADAQQEPRARAFWFTMQVFAQLVADGQLSSSLYVKQLFGLINSQMRRLAQGNATLAEGMLRDALFLIASVLHPTPKAQQLRRACQLDGLVPPDFEARCDSQPEPEALQLAATEVNPACQIETSEAEASTKLQQNLPRSQSDRVPAPVALALVPGKVLEFPSAAAAHMAHDDNFKRVGDLEISFPLYSLYLAETDELLRLLFQDFSEWRHESQRPVSAAALQAVHTLTSSSGTVGFKALCDLAQALETAITAAPSLSCAQCDVLDNVLEGIKRMLQSFALGELAPGQQALIAALHELHEQLALASATAAEADGAIVGSPPGCDEPEPVLETAPATAKLALVRVRADILDGLLDQAGDISTVGSKLENKIGTLRSSLSDFSENLTRLRRQLREIEMQAESQIASRMAISSKSKFDPLEFDRFTRLQELTRMMAESVNDIDSLHQNLSDGVDRANADLTLQAHLTHDLQCGLQRVRMLPFSSIGKRLFRVARQSAKEIDQRINLDIRGGAVEIERSMLERMTVPFEHVLRNAIVYGFEPRSARGAAGKDETGALLVQVCLHGDEVAIAFGDDGAGLDPGRGAGMDTVRSEVQALGGHIDTVSEPGKGTSFTIHLPLTPARKDARRGNAQD